MGGERICALEMSPSHGQPFFGGDPFMRSAYAFFDLDEKTVSIAPERRGIKDSNIVPIGPGHVPALPSSG